MINEERMETINTLIGKQLGDEYTSMIVDISKNNGNQKGFSIRRKSDGIGINYYVTDEMETQSNAEIAIAAIDLYKANDPAKTGFAERFRLFEEKLSTEYIYRHVLPRIIGTEGNESYLKELPHVEVNDALALVFYLETDVFEGAVVRIGDGMFEKYSLNLKELLENANQNVMNGDDTKAVLFSLFESVGASIEEDPVGMYILTNEKKCYGAVNAIIPEVMDKILDDWGMDGVIVLPSSVHEVILLRNGSDFKLDDYLEIVKSVNGEDVLPEEKLADGVFRYTRENGLEKVA